VRGILITPGARLAAADTPTALLPVGGKALIEYPLEMLLVTGIRRVLVVAPAADAAQIQRHLGGGERWVAYFSYLIGPPDGDAAAAIALAGEFLGGSQVAVARADTITAGAGLQAQLKNATQPKGARIFVCAGDLSRHPRVPLSGGGGSDESGGGDGAAGDGDGDAGTAGDGDPGLAFYDGSAAAKVADLTRESGRASSGDLHRAYQNQGRLRVEQFAPAVAVVRVTGAESLAAAERAIAAADDSP